MTGRGLGEGLHHDPQKLLALSPRRLVHALRTSVDPSPDGAPHSPAHLALYTDGTDCPLTGVVVPRDLRVPPELGQVGHPLHEVPRDSTYVLVEGVRIAQLPDPRLVLLCHKLLIPSVPSVGPWMPYPGPSRTALTATLSS